MLLQSEREYIDFLQTVEDWRLERIYNRTEEVIKLKEKEGDRVSLAYRRAVTKRGQVRAEIARRRQNTNCFT